MGKLRFLTAGESHGEALLGILDGMPRGLPLSLDDFRILMEKSWLGYGRFP
ncbi:MAG: chorismate synthase [Candidatus Riflebacteria bacterium]|nr:chorismate synthase [Candidatus Riflebacteria bacterium]